MRLRIVIGALGAVVLLGSGCSPAAKAVDSTSVAPVDSAATIDPVGAPGHPKTIDTLRKRGDTTTKGDSGTPPRGGSTAGRGRATL
jgi:hypothetical protein